MCVQTSNFNSEFNEKNIAWIRKQCTEYS